MLLFNSISTLLGYLMPIRVSFMCIYIYIYIYMLKLMGASNNFKIGISPVDWGCRIHRLHLCRVLRLPKECLNITLNNEMSRLQ